MNDLVTFETAVLLKELGFDNISCPTCYCIGYLSIKEDREFRGSPRKTVKRQFHLALAPHLYEAQKWLREEHKVRVFVIQGVIGNFNYVIYKWNNDNNLGKWERLGNISSIDTYEEALESGIQDSLTYLKSMKDEKFTEVS